jgi:enoyl-CoA hydratase
MRNSSRSRGVRLRLAGGGSDAYCATHSYPSDARQARTLCVLSMSNIARLSALVGPARVIEMVFTARLLCASDALAAGLVSEVLPDHAALEARAMDLATLVGSHAPLTLRATREALRRLRDALPLDEDLIRMCYTSQDFEEGMQAFLAERSPVWRGE